jgi:hypothetical protein
MQTFYQTTAYSTDIKAVQVTKVTEKTVTLAATKYQREHRTNRSGSWNTYHATFDEAKAHLVAKLQRRIEAAKTAIVRDELDLATVQALTQPTRNETDV